MPALLQSLTSYVPGLVVRRAIANPVAMLETAALEHFPGAVLFADISGFTALTERLAQHGPVGAEELTNILNSYFGQLIEIINSYGGDVVKFAGDALLAVWSANGDETLTQTTLRAARCALAVQTRLQGYQTTEGNRLSLRVIIGAGEIFTINLGGVKVREDRVGRWEFLVTGPPVVQISNPEYQSRPGDVVLSPEAWLLVRDYCVGQERVSGSARLIEIRFVGDSLRPKALPGVSNNSLTYELNPAVERVLQQFIPGAILSRLEAGQTDWLAELRRVTILFINLPDLNYTTSLALAQSVMQELQIAVYRYEGSINKLSVDDKGSTLVAAFGLPPLAHEDDALRGLQAALDIQAKLRELHLRGAIGITTGRAFCGVVGSEQRCEYTMLGTVVNLAARLMQKASDDILCDEATFHAANSAGSRTRIAFENLPPLKVKGKAEPLVNYRPKVIDDYKPENQNSQSKSQNTIVGRVAEREIFAREIEALQNGGAGGVILVEGEAGIGKSRLVRDLIDNAKNAALMTLVGAGDAFEKKTPYFAWRGIFSQLLDLSVLTDVEAQRQHVLEVLSWKPELLPFAPLLNEMLPLELPANEFTAQMSGQVKADNTRSLLVGLLEVVTSLAPTVLVLEDAHWLDSVSWALALAVAQRVKSLLLVLATRPLTVPVPNEYEQILKVEGCRQLKLQELSDEQLSGLVCQRLGVKALPLAVRVLIQEKAQGNPFFSEELAYALRDSGLIVIEHGTCRIAPEAGDLHNLNFPDTVQGVITSRIDRLPPPQQLMLKVASVIGRVFTFQTLRDVHPVETDKLQLAGYLAALSNLDIAHEKPSEPELSYEFKHVIIREVTYNLMLFAQRRQLHRVVAEWYERNYAMDLSRFYPLLAYHWNEGEEISKAVFYFEKAGEQALQNGTFQEAIGFFNQALTLNHNFAAPSGEVRQSAPSYSSTSKAQPLTPNLTRLATWQRQLGEAYFGLGQLVESEKHLKQALDLLGYTMPVQPRQLMVGLLRQLAHQTQQRLTLRWLQRYINNSQLTVLLEAARVYDLLAQVYYLSGNRRVGLYAAITMLNLSEKAGPSPELARAYSNMGVAAGVIRLHKLARTYNKLARAALRSPNPTSTNAFVAQTNAIYHIGIGDWIKTRVALDEAMAINAEVGDWWRWTECASITVHLLYYQGDFGACIKLWSEYQSIITHHNYSQQPSWGWLVQAESYLSLGQPDKAIEVLQSLVPLTNRKDTLPVHLQTQASLAFAYLQKGDLAAAQATLAKTVQQVTNTAPALFTLFDFYVTFARVYLALWEKEQTLAVTNQKLGLVISNPQPSTPNPQVLLAVKALWRFARVFAIGKPRAWLYQGLYYWLIGKSDKAERAWRKSLELAQRLAMPYDQGLAHYEIGRHLPLNDPTRQQHLERACQIFTRLGASYDLAMLRSQTEAIEVLIA